MASGRLGIKRTSIKRRLEGRCVKTFVFTRPKRAAGREASSAAAGVTDVARTIGISTAPLFVGLMTSLQIFCRASALSKCRCRRVPVRN